MAEILKLDDARQLDFDRETVEQAYDRWAPVYDLVFGGVFSKGRKAAIQATNKIGGRVLEVGIGTGISLPQYAPHLRIFGTDISEAMLRKAKRRVIEQRLQPVVRPLGFRTAEFAWSRYAQWLAGARAVELVERRLVPPVGHFSLVRIRKTARAA
jgi:SAM-dependent methyltransferase